MSAVIDIRREDDGWKIVETASGRTVLTIPPAWHPSDVETRAMHVEAELKAAKTRRSRPCLTCRTPFVSEGPHNRLCPSCRQVGLGKDMLG